MQHRRDERQARLLDWLRTDVGCVREASKDLGMPLPIALREFKALHKQGLVRYGGGRLFDRVWKLTSDGREAGRQSRSSFSSSS